VNETEIIADIACSFLELSRTIFLSFRKNLIISRKRCSSLSKKISVVHFFCSRILLLSIEALLIKREIRYTNQNNSRYFGAPCASSLKKTLKIEDIERVVLSGKIIQKNIEKLSHRPN
jgi:hypothetical protein